MPSMILTEFPFESSGLLRLNHPMTGNILSCRQRGPIENYVRNEHENEKPLGKEKRIGKGQDQASSQYNRKKL